MRDEESACLISRWDDFWTENDTQRPFPSPRKRLESKAVQKRGEMLKKG